MKPDLKIAPDSESGHVQVYFDVGSKAYGIRKTERITRKDACYIEATKSIEMTIEQFGDFLEEATSFMGIHKQYSKKGE
jgi:hypothetical protein